MRALLFTVVCTVVLALGGTVYFALKPGLAPSGARVVLKIEPFESAMEGGRVGQASVAEAETDAAPQGEERSAAPVEAAAEPAPSQPADPFQSAFNTPGPGKAIGADLQPADGAGEAGEAVPAAETGELPVAGATDFRKSAMETESVSSVSVPAEPSQPRFASAETDQPAMRPGLDTNAAPEERAAPEIHAALEPRPGLALRPGLETHPTEQHSAALQEPTEPSVAQQERSVALREPSSAVEEQPEGLPFREGADIGASAGQSVSSGEGVTLEGAVFAEAPQEILDQAVIESGDALAEPMVPNTAGQGVNQKGKPAKRDMRPEPKRPPSSLYFSAGTVATAAKAAPTPDLIPIGGDDASGQ